MSGGKTYVLTVTTSKVVAPMLAPAIAQGAIEAMCSFETFPAAVSDDVEALREHARKICERLPTVEGWSTFEVPVIGDDSDDD